MKQYFKIVILPSILIIICINIIAKNPSKDDINGYIRKAIASGNYEVARREYRNLIASDFNNIDYHRGYINSFRFSRRSANVDASRVDTIVAYYMSFLKSNDPNILDIAHYCLGFIKVQKHDYGSALNFYSKVQNKDLKYLNNSIGYCYLQLNDLEKAKNFFKREIELAGNLAGALDNYVEILLYERNTEKLQIILENQEYKDLIRPSDRRKFFFIKHKYISYVMSIILSYKQNVILEGFTASLLICTLWFVFIKRLDIFEPEKFRYLFLTLLLSIVFSDFAYFLYDLFHLYFHFELKGGILTELAYCIFGIGLIEELVKLIPVFIILFCTKQINESTDYIIYASISALGFACMENLGYFHEFGLKSIGGRAIVCAIGHMAMSSFAIYGLVLSKYQRKSMLYFILSFFLACSVHGLYDFFLVTSSWLHNYFALSFILALASIGVYQRIIINVLNNSEYFKLIDCETSLNTNGRILVYGLSYMIVVQYLIMVSKFGPRFTNEKSSIISLFVIFIIYANFTHFTLRRKSWLPLFKKKVRHKKKE